MVLIDNETPFHKASLFYIFAMRMYEKLKAFQYPFKDVCTEETYLRKNDRVSTFMEELAYRERVHNQAHVWYTRFIADNAWFVEEINNDITSPEPKEKKISLRFGQLWRIYKSQHNLHDEPFTYRCNACKRLVETEVYGDYLESKRGLVCCDACKLQADHFL